ncbi:FKBP-type peptidyl-prolyl cis-trans isomerase [Pantoea dispersa]|uniref:FKBP-type peptidyl-prolyl cis-trans isomerase n=1 Tax=Pantoea dispersa TaxID=59814 RepID=UPI002DB8DCF9|nr:FKBP-type peptidyl-prolyl cis-trans isomerase [Pantoea dispersa]MEB5974301.1 FKBP-type peptidyl-prolyl cis-trans isomerase [Pantoea dispersa]
MKRTLLPAVLSVEIASAFFFTIAHAAPQLTGFSSIDTIPETLFDDSEPAKPWLKPQPAQRKVLRPATTQKIDHDKRIQSLQNSLTEQQRLHQQTLADYQVEKSKLQQQLTAQKADQEAVRSMRARLNELEQQVAQSQPDKYLQQLSELRIQLAAQQQLVDTKTLQQSALSEKLQQKEQDVVELSQQLEALRAPAQSPVIKPETQTQKLSYANGVAFASNIVQSLQAQQNLGIHPDRPMVLAGIQDAFAQRIALNSEEITTLVNDLDQQLNSSLQSQQENKAYQREQQHKSGKAFLEQTRKRKGVKSLKGAYYLVTKAGSGETLKADSTVDLLLTGRLPDGTVFDSSGKENKAQRVKLNSLLPALTNILSTLKSGSEVEVILPPEEAFGDEGVDNLIPPGAVVIFDIKLKA